MTEYLEAAAVDWNDAGTVAVYDELPLWSAMAGLLLFEELPLRAGTRVLDLGPGTGFPLLDLAERLGPGGGVTGLDPWRPALERARAKLRAWQVTNAHIVLGDGSAMPFAAGAFDLVVSNLGLNNFADAAAAVAECARVLRPGGTIALTTNLRGHMREFYAAFESVLAEAGLPHAVEALRAHVDHRATVDGVRTLFEGAGLHFGRAVEREMPIRFASGSALLRHHFIRLGFLDAWKAVVPGSDRVRVFARLEHALNEAAGRKGGLTLTIPLAYVEGMRE